MRDATRVLVVDDDPELCDLIREYLSEEGFAVSVAHDGAAMRSALEAAPADLVLLDLKLPDGDGFALGAEIRRRGDAGLIVVSGKGDIVDRVAALEAGADDYVTKPFHLRELLARLRSVLRRRSEPSTAEGGGGADAAERGAVRRFAGWRFEVDGRTLFAPDGRPVALTTGEIELLVAFLDHPQRALSRDRLLDLVHNGEAEPFDRSVDMRVGRLRRKIEADPAHPVLIKTVRGVGYKLDCAVQRQ